MKTNEHDKVSDLAFPWRKEKKITIPMVVIMDPAMTKVYGSYKNTELRGQEYRKIFRDAMKAHKADVSDRKIIDPRDNAAQVAEGEELPADAVRKFTNGQFEDWTSSAGSTISATLVSASREKAIFVDRNGREIELTMDQLDEESAKRVKSRL